MSKQFPLINVMSPADQRKALKFLTDIVKDADKANPDCTGYDNNEDTMELRVFLMRVGALPDRRKGKK